MARFDGRAFDALRPIEMLVHFHRPSEGSVLYRAGGTVVLCTASVDDKVPPFLEGKGQGWLTAEYEMHPRANPRRQERDGRGKAPSGRTQEIQRPLAKLGVRALREPIAATSAGHVEGGIALDLCYVEDSAARVDLNVVATKSARIVEVQGTAEGEPIERKEVDAMVDLALAGIAKLIAIQEEALTRAGVDISKLRG